MRSTCSRIEESSPAIRSTSSSLTSSRASRATCSTCSRSITGLILSGGGRRAELAERLEHDVVVSLRRDLREHARDDPVRVDDERGRATPMYLRPYIDFSPQVPYASATAWSASASSVKSSEYLSANRLTSSTGSGETPITRAPEASYSAERSRTPHACLVHPGVSALG